MPAATIALRAAAATGIAAFVAIGAVSVMLIATGVFATAAPSWTARFEVAGHRITVGVPGLIRLATLPGVAHLLDGRTLEHRAGTIGFRRSGRTLVAVCAPCRLEHPGIATGPLVVGRLELGVERQGAELNGWLAADAARVHFVAQLAPDALRIRWTLPATQAATWVRVFASVVPEAAYARVEGMLRAEGTLLLPAWHGTVAFGTTGLEVGGLGTEALQDGWLAFRCATAAQSRRTVTGAGEPGWLPLDRIGDPLVAAVIAAEDQRFRLHAGFDEHEIATLLAAFHGTPQRGASTLTQQLARTLFTGGEPTAARKLRELLYAVEMERTLGKERILELYLNTVDWGPGICGARAAARTYFRKRPDQLTPLQAAWLAGILRAPHAAHHAQFLGARPETARALGVLRQMRAVPKHERERWASRPLQLAAPPRRGAPG
jgi:hypothetical protein